MRLIHAINRIEHGCHMIDAFLLHYRRQRVLERLLLLGYVAIAIMQVDRLTVKVGRTVTIELVLLKNLLS